MNCLLYRIISRRSILGLLIAMSLLATDGLVTASGDTSSPTLTTLCGSLTMNTSVFFSGRSGTILFNCKGKPALTVSRAGRFEPVFTLPSGYVGLTIVPHTLGASTCAGGPGLTSGTVFTFAAPGNFDYCGLYSNYPAAGLSSFRLTWNKK